MGKLWEGAASNLLHVSSKSIQHYAPHIRVALGMAEFALRVKTQNIVHNQYLAVAVWTGAYAYGWES